MISCQNIQVKFMCEGHRVKGTVTGATNILVGIACQMVSGVSRC